MIPSCNPQNGFVATTCMRFTESIKGWGPCDCPCFMPKVWLPSPVFVLELQSQNVGGLTCRGHATAVPLLRRPVSTMADGLLLSPVLTARRCHSVTTGAFFFFFTKADKKEASPAPPPVTHNHAHTSTH